MLVHAAENGYTFEIECEPTTSVETAQQKLEILSGIPVNDQLLISGGVRLDPRNALSNYKLPCEGQYVFLFNKARLVPNCPPPPAEHIEIPKFAIPQPSSSSQNSHPLDNATDPALKALPSYEREFKYHSEKAGAIYAATQAMHEICQNLLQRLYVQDNAIENARSNMDYTFNMIDSMYTEFMSHFERQKRQHIYYLSDAERYTETLRNWKLHPVLQTNRRKSVLDITGEEKLRRHMKACTDSHKQFESLVSQLRQSYSELKKNVQNFLCAKSAVKIQQVDEVIKNNVIKISEQSTIMQTLCKDVDRVKTLVQECLHQRLPSSLRPHDAVSALGPMYEIHESSHLPKMESCMKTLLKSLEFCKSRKQLMNQYVHNSMQKVASLQFSIRDMRYQLMAFKEAMARQDELFGKLELDRKVGPAYRACLAEVVRRKAAIKLYMGQAGRVAEQMADLRTREVSRREEFLKIHSSFIPRDIFDLLGLTDVPSQCVVDIRPFDCSLLDIDVQDLEKYAPESFVGALPKFDHSMQGKRNLSPSRSGSCISGRSEEGFSNIINEDDASSIAAEECSSDEIIGTSKLEVENAWLKAELASAIAYISSFAPDIDYDSLDGSNIEDALQCTAKKTAEALHYKDEYAKQLQKLLMEKEIQRLSYEKRIQELEQKLSEQYSNQNILSDRRDFQESLLNEPVSKVDVCSSEVTTMMREGIMQTSTVPEPMDEGSGPSLACLEAAKAESVQSRGEEAIDENMAEFSGTLFSEVNTAETIQSNDSMLAFNETEDQNINTSLKTAGNTENLVASQSINECPNYLDEVAAENNTSSEETDSLLSRVQTELEEKTRQYAAAQTELEFMRESVASLKRDLDENSKLLNESQMNCAHLENCLHEAREEAQTNLCAADRRATEYNALRASSVRLRAMLERLKVCIAAPVGVAAGFPESLHSLALAVSSVSTDESEDDATLEFRTCIRILAEKVGCLFQQRADILERLSRTEAAHRRVSKDFERQSELVKNLYTKNKMERQVNKEKISFIRFEVHELAAFVRNSQGHYEAVNRNCRNYYLSEESIALFVDSMPTGRQYIIGQIVHIQRNVSKEPPSSNSSRFRTNPYGLPIGTEYFVVTVAMVPDTIQSLHP